MKVTTYKTFYHEDHGAILKHKCGKRDSSIVPSLFFSHFISFFLLFFFGLSFFSFWPFSFFRRTFLTWENALIMKIITLLFTLQLKNYNSILRTKYDSMWMPPAVYRDVQWFKSDMYEKLWTVTLPQIRCQLHDHASNMTMMNVSWWTEWWKVAWQYISEWLWKCHNR